MTKKSKNVLKRILYSMHARMLVAFIIGAVLATLTYLAIRLSMMASIDSNYATDEARLQRENNYILDLQTFVDDNDISLTDADKIINWVSHNRYAYIMLYMNDELFYSGAGGTEDSEDGDSSSQMPGVGVSSPTLEEIKEYAKENELHTITMHDGTLLASVADFSEYFYYDMVNVVSLIGAFAVLALVMMMYFFGITRRIATLSRDVKIVSEVNMNHSIHTAGNDELAGLSRNVEQMRSSILENIEKEKQALDANAELITSMSHDIRTPLTVLLGYIDLMKLRAEDDVMKEYIKASESTALRLKELSDDMFRYFVVFGNGVIDVELNNYDAKTLIEQLLSEHMLLLSENGYSVKAPSEISFEPGLLLRTDAPKAMRIIDNVFSNIYKYADASSPIEFYTELGAERFTICVSNKINTSADRAESTGIGLKTCQKIAEAMDMIFEYSESNSYFETKIGIRIIRGETDD